MVSLLALICDLSSVYMLCWLPGWNVRNIDPGSYIRQRLFFTKVFEQQLPAIYARSGIENLLCRLSPTVSMDAPICFWREYDY